MKKTFKAMTESPLFIKLSEGNLKLKPNTDTKFLIWNILAVVTCPFATEHCKQFCYALKSERVYPSCKASRKDHLVASLSSSFEKRMLFSIDAYMNKPSYKNAKQVIFRIHESGDFYSKAYADKWLTIIRECESKYPNLKFTTYTKSIDYLPHYDELPGNLTVRFSLWDDTEKIERMKADSKGYPVYTAVEKFTTEIKAANRCGCVDCAKCSKCWNDSINWLACEIH